MRGLATFKQSLNCSTLFWWLGVTSRTRTISCFRSRSLDTGLTGLIVWLSCLLLVLVGCIRTWRLAGANRDPLLAGMSAGLFCGQLTMMVHGLTDAPLWATRPSLIVWGLWGLALALPAAGASITEIKG